MGILVDTAMLDSAFLAGIPDLQDVDLSLAAELEQARNAFIRAEARASAMVYLARQAQVTASVPVVGLQKRKKPSVARPRKVGARSYDSTRAKQTRERNAALRANGENVPPSYQRKTGRPYEKSGKYIQFRTGVKRRNFTGGCVGDYNKVIPLSYAKHGVSANMDPSIRAAPTAPAREDAEAEAEDEAEADAYDYHDDEAEDGDVEADADADDAYTEMSGGSSFRNAPAVPKVRESPKGLFALLSDDEGELI
jgi:hypothetical protein